MNTKVSETLDQPESARRPRVSWLSKLLFLVVFLGGLLTLFYAEENWRGRRAWEKERAHLEARGESLDWEKTLMTPPPDEQNIWKAPGIEAEFLRDPTKRGAASPARKPVDEPKLEPLKEAYVSLGEIEFVTPDSPKAAGAIRFDALVNNPTARDAFYRAFLGQTLYTPDALYWLCEKAPSNARLVVVAEAPPKADAFKEAISKPGLGPYMPKLILEEMPEGKMAVRRETKGWATAEEFLNSPNEKLQKLLNVHEAAKRPKSWMPGSYQTPFEVPNANFVLMRTLAQYAGSRAQACILLHRGAEALTNVTYIFDLCRLLEAKPLTLVNVMINGAIHGLSSNMIEEGFREDVWGPAELAALKEMAEGVDLVSPVIESLRTGERAGISRLLANTSGADFERVFRLDDGKSGLKQRIIKIMPRGWIYQNSANYAKSMQIAIDSVQLNPLLVRPEDLDRFSEIIDAKSASSSPFWSLAMMALPNISKSVQVASKNQTQARFVATAAALELFRREKGNYPEKLEQLVPNYLAAVPQDLISPTPLRYRRIDSKYLLYSPGWDKKESVETMIARNGPAPFDVSVLSNLAVGDDWVWKGIPRVRHQPPLATATR